MLSRSKSFVRSLKPTVNVEDISKSVTSASTSRLSGIVRSSASLISSRFRLSFNPGIPNPTTILLFPSEITFPLSIVTFVKLSFGRIIPVIITKAVYMFSVLPFTSTFFLDLFS